MSVILNGTQWFEVGRRIFISWDATEDAAACVSRSLVESDLAGIASHGVLRIPMYHGFVKDGKCSEWVRNHVEQYRSVSCYQKKE